MAIKADSVLVARHVFILHKPFLGNLVEYVGRIELEKVDYWWLG
jgi:hypothetical protein